MGRIANAWKALTGKRPSVAQGMQWLPGTGVRYLAPASRKDYARLAGELRHNSVLSIAANWLARQALQGVWSSGYKDEEGNWEGDDASILTRTLRKPNPFWGARVTWSGVFTDVFFHGNAFIVKAGADRGVPTELYWRPARLMTVIAQTDEALAQELGPVDRYRYEKPGGGFEEYPPDRVVHIRDLIDPINPILGMSRIEAQIRNVCAINAGERWTVGILENGTAGTVLSPKQSVESVKMGEQVDEATMKAQANAVKGALRGDGVGGVHSTTLPVEAVQFGVNPEDMAVNEMLDRPEGMLLAAAGLNPMALSMQSSAASRTFSNYKEALKDAWHNGVIPYQDVVCDALTDHLALDYDESGELNVWLDNDDVEALKEDMNERVERATMGYSSTLWNRNGSLKLGEFPPVEGADGELYFGQPTEVDKANAEEDFKRQQEMMAQQSGQPAADEDGEPVEDEGDSRPMLNGKQRLPVGAN